MDSVFYSQVFSLSLLWIIAIPADSYLLVKKKIKEQYIGNAVGSVIQIILLFLGILWGGLLGLVLARIGISLTNSALSIILYEISSKKA
jgi:O-antigen/teichoic acid export membrane protein